MLKFNAFTDIRKDFGKGIILTTWVLDVLGFRNKTSQTKLNIELEVIVGNDSLLNN